MDDGCDSTDAVARFAGEGLSAAAMATRGLWFANPTAPASEMREAMEARTFDVAPLGEFPVRRYVMCHELGGDQSTAEFAHLILAEDLTDGGLPLSDVIDRLVQRKWLFVLDRGRVNGIITQADLQRPPVDLTIFGFALMLEKALNTLIAQASDGEWQHLLVDESLRSVRRDFKRLVQQNTQLTYEQCLTLKDRLDLAAKLGIWKALGFDTREEFEAAGKRMRHLRNDLAHGRSLLASSKTPSESLEVALETRDLARLADQVVERGDLAWAAMRRTEFEAQRDGDRWTALSIGRPGTDELAHVITAWNPGSRPRSRDENEEANRELLARITTLTEDVRPLLARSARGSWAEESFLVTGMSRADACSIGREFGQLAVFELEDGELRVIRCKDDKVVATRAQSPPSDSTG